MLTGVRYNDWTNVSKKTIRGQVPIVFSMCTEIKSNRRGMAIIIIKQLYNYIYIYLFNRDGNQKNIRSKQNKVTDLTRNGQNIETKPAYYEMGKPHHAGVIHSCEMKTAEQRRCCVG